MSACFSSICGPQIERHVFVSRFLNSYKTNENVQWQISESNLSNNITSNTKRTSQNV